MTARVCRGAPAAIACSLLRVPSSMDPAAASSSAATAWAAVGLTAVAFTSLVVTLAVLAWACLAACCTAYRQRLGELVIPARWARHDWLLSNDAGVAAARARVVLRCASALGWLSTALLACALAAPWSFGGADVLLPSW